MQTRNAVSTGIVVAVLATIGARAPAIGKRSADHVAKPRAHTASATVTVTTKATPCLNVRAGPDTHTPIEKCLPYGTRVTATDECKVGQSINGDHKWFEIGVGTRLGFISAYYTSDQNGTDPGVPELCNAIGS